MVSGARPEWTRAAPISKRHTRTSRRVTGLAGAQPIASNRSPPPAEMSEIALDVCAEGGGIGRRRKGVVAPAVRDREFNRGPALNRRLAPIPSQAKIPRDPRMARRQGVALQAFGKIRDRLVIDVIRTNSICRSVGEKAGRPNPLVPVGDPLSRANHSGVRASRSRLRMTLAPVIASAAVSKALTFRQRLRVMPVAAGVRRPSRCFNASGYAERSAGSLSRSRATRRTADIRSCRF